MPTINIAFTVEETANEDGSTTLDHGVSVVLPEGLQLSEELQGRITGGVLDLMHEVLTEDEATAGENGND